MAFSNCQFSLRNFLISYSSNILSKNVTVTIRHITKCTNQLRPRTGRPNFTRSFSLYQVKNNSGTTCIPRNIWARRLSCSQLNSQQSGERTNEDDDAKELENEVDGTVNIGEGTWQEVYSGVLTTQLKLLKMFSIGTSVIGLSVQPILYEKLGTADITIVVTLASFLGFFTFITPALIHWVSKKYVTKLEYDPERDIYAATTLSFFLKEKKVHFKIDDVIRPEIPGMFTSFLVKNRPLFVDPSMFENIEHYGRIMGYDKPIDLSFDRDKKRR